MVGQVDGSIPEHDLLSLLDGNSIERRFTKFKLTAEGTEDHQSETGSDQTNDRIQRNGKKYDINVNQEPATWKTLKHKHIRKRPNS